MRLLFVLLFSVFLFACNNEKENNSTDQKNSDVKPAKSIPVEPVKEIDLEVYIDNFRIRTGPGVDEKEIARLPKNTIVIYNGEKSMHSTAINLRGIKLNAPWLKIKTKEGLEGWIYAAGVKSASPQKVAATKVIDEIHMNSFFDKKIVDQIKNYQNQLDNSKTSKAFAETYLLGESTQNNINEILGDKVEIDDPSNILDMSWLERSLVGYQNSMVAEATTFNIFKDFKKMYSIVKETEGNEDDDFIKLQFKVNELDSVEYFYKSWFMQTWDYGGHSLLGQGKHFNILKEVDHLLAKSNLFEKPLLDIKQEILNDISAEYITYWESKDKILEEMKNIVETNFAFLTKEDKILIKTRYDQFKNPIANKIEVNKRSY